MNKKIKLLLAFYGFLFFIFTMVVLGMLLFFISDDENENGHLDSSYGNMSLSEEVLAYQPMVEEICSDYGIEEYVPVILAIMQVESKGLGSDVMQASESLGLPLNSLSPEASINQGCKYFSQLLEQGEQQGVDLDTVIQAYNYGGGFISYVSPRGKEYTFELAMEFSKEKAKGVIVTYNNPIAIEINGGWRYKYGNMFYVQLVSQYLAPAHFDDELLQEMMNEALKYQGWSYVWGGSNPNTGFDCSGLTQWIFKSVGISLPRTAQEQYNASTRISDEEAKPGDLVFFQGTHPYANITHVGVYVGNGMMYDSNTTGIGYSQIDSAYWQQYFVGFGRVVN